MAVLIETSYGDIVVDLYTKARPKCSLNFLKLCKLKYYNYCIFHSVQKDLVAQTGDPDGTGKGGNSVYEYLYGPQARFFDMELKPKIKHRRAGLISMVNNGHNQHGSQFFITLENNLDYLDGSHTVFGEVTEGHENLEKINEAFCDKENRPYRNIRIYRTTVLDDPFPDPPGLSFPDRSPEPTQGQIESDRIEADEDINEFEGLSKEEVEEILEDRAARANAQILEIIGDLPSADVRPDEATLFICKLNPVTTSEDLNIIFSRFGDIKSCEVIKDKKTDSSLQYAFIEFYKKEDCEEAFFKMENVLIDDRRIHVDFSQSVAKEWHRYHKTSGGETIASRRENALVLKDFERRDQKKFDYVFDEKKDRSRFRKNDSDKVMKHNYKQSESSSKYNKNRSRSPRREKNESHKRRRSSSGSRSPVVQSRSNYRNRRDSSSDRRSRHHFDSRRNDSRYREIRRN